MRTKTILVVDDSEDDLLLLKRMFRNAGLLNDIQTVSTIQDAICYLKGEGIYEDRHRFPFPILLLLDLHLADGSGIDVLNWLKGNQAKTSLAIVVLTGSDIGAIRQSYELGANSFLTKPLRFPDFENMVAHARGIKLTSSAAGRQLEPD